MVGDLLIENQSNDKTLNPHRGYPVNRKAIKRQNPEPALRVTRSDLNKIPDLNSIKIHIFEQRYSFFCKMN